MSKELKALEDIILYLNASEPKGLYCENIEIIKNALKNYEELTNKQVILCGRMPRKTQAIIDMICKNYKEVAITNLEDDKRLKAFEIIKKYPRCSLQRYIILNEIMVEKGYKLTKELLFSYDIPCSVEEYNIVIEVLLNEIH